MIITYTCEALSETAYHELGRLSNVNNSELQKIRRIWVPFHFLPGNMKHELVNGYGFVTDLKNFSIDRDLPDFKCVCAPNSELVGKMIQRITGNNTSLLRIGIAMHVLADTWAHQLFVGSPNAYINDVSDLIENKHSNASNGTPDIGTAYSVTYLGHGRAGHLPDIPSQSYQYTPSWSTVKANVSNPVRFYNAFCQMVDVMVRLKTQNHDAFMLKDYLPGGIDLWDRNANEMIHNRITEVLWSRDEDQSQKWNEEFRELADPRAFNLNVEITKLNEFEQEAFAHLNFVMNGWKQLSPGISNKQIRR